MSDREDQELDRRSFVTGALGAAAGIGVSALLATDATAQQGPPAGAPPAGGPPPDAIPVSMRRPASSYKLEADVRDCQVDGKVPKLEFHVARANPLATSRRAMTFDPSITST